MNLLFYVFLTHWRKTFEILTISCPFTRERKHYYGINTIINRITNVKGNRELSHIIYSCIKFNIPQMSYAPRRAVCFSYKRSAFTKTTFEFMLCYEMTDVLETFLLIRTESILKQEEDGNKELRTDFQTFSRYSA